MNAHSGPGFVVDDPIFVPMTNVWYPLTLLGYATSDQGNLSKS